ELIEGIEQALSEHFEVADGVPVGGETDENLAVVGGNSNGNQVTGRKREEWVAGDELRTGSIKRYLRSRDIGDHQVVLFAHHLGGCSYAERVQGSRCKASNVGERARTYRPSRVLVGLGVVGDLVQPHQRVRRPDREGL